MSENIQRNSGVAPNYKYDRGGMKADFGPFVGVVKTTLIQLDKGGYKFTSNSLLDQIQQTSLCGAL